MTKVILFIAASLSFILQGTAQTPPSTPETPKKGTSYSISISSDSNDKYSNTSVSIKKTADMYKLTASFNRNRTHEVREALLNNLGKKGLTVNGSTYLWTQNARGDEAFECKLTKGHLRMTMDKNAVSTTVYDSMVTMGIALRDLIAGTDSKEDAKKDLDRAQKDLERAQRDLDRARKDLERAKKKN